MHVQTTFSMGILSKGNRKKQTIFFVKKTPFWWFVDDEEFPPYILQEVRDGPTSEILLGPHNYGKKY